MKAYIYLYPTRRFFDFLAKRYHKGFEDSNSSPERINDIIDARYRKKGYKVHWLMFGAKNNHKKPDLSLVSKSIIIHEEDVILVAGVSYRNILIDKKYPDCAFILSQMGDLTELVIGGFHQWDCVDKLARFAYQKGIPTFVDEDTTEMFFEKTSLSGEIPLCRKKVLLGTGKKERMTRIIERGFGIDKQMIENAKEIRKERPWFRQI